MKILFEVPLSTVPKYNFEVFPVFDILLLQQLCDSLANNSADYDFMFKTYMINFEYDALLLIKTTNRYVK